VRIVKYVMILYNKMSNVKCKVHVNGDYMKSSINKNAKQLITNANGHVELQYNNDDDLWEANLFNSTGDKHERVGNEIKEFITEIKSITPACRVEQLGGKRKTKKTHKTKKSKKQPKKGRKTRAKNQKK